MRHFLHFLVLLLLLEQKSNAQVITNTTYPFTIDTGAVSAPIGFDTILGFYQSNTVSPMIEFGSDFTFNFAGHAFDSFCVSASGWVKLGAPGSQYNNSNVGSTVNWPIIAPYLSNWSTSYSGSVLYKLVGTAPNRTCIIQWRNMTHSPFITTPSTFEARLHESTGKLSFVYGSIPYNQVTYAVGIGASFNSINSFASVVTATTWSMSTCSYGVNYSRTTAIGAGTMYTFTPDSTPSLPPVNGNSTAYAACIMLSWEDSSTTEKVFDVYKSTDSVNYTFLDSIHSVSDTGIGDVYSVFDTALAYNTIFHYRIVSRTWSASPVQWIAISDTTLFPQMCGTVNVPGDFATIHEVLEEIKCRRLCGPLTIELNNSYNPALETFPLTFPGDTITSPINTITVRPDTNATGISITGTHPSTLIDCHKSSHIFFDGRPGGIGFTSELTISNSSPSGSTIRIIHDSKNIGISYCKVNGSNYQNANGVIYIGSTVLTNGNDNIRIDHCEIGKSVFTPVNLITSYNTVASNDSIVITNCLFHDFAQSNFVNISSAIYFRRGNSHCIFENNSIYHTSVSVPTIGGRLHYIYINDSAGIDYRVNNNYIGGTAPLCGGNPIIWTGSGTCQLLFVNSDTLSWIHVNGNVINNIKSYSSAPAVGITVVGGNSEIGGQLGNIIGDTTGNYGVDMQVGSLMGLSGGNNDSCIIRFNKISGIRAASGFTGISSAECNYLDMSNNVIGHITNANSILVTGPSDCQGITVGKLFGQASIMNNVVANIWLAGSGLGYNRSMCGISCGWLPMPVNTSFTLFIKSNKIYNLHSDASDMNSHIATLFNVCGIYARTQFSKIIITDNLINNITCNSSYSQIFMTGIMVVNNNNTSGPNNYIDIERNVIHSVWMNNSSNLSIVAGITTCLGLHNTYNNMVCLGLDAQGNSVIGGAQLYGYFSRIGGSDVFNNIIHNSFYIGGTGNSGVSSSACIKIDDTGQDSIFNNIVCNVRYDTLLPSGYDHIGIQLLSGANSNYNLFYTPGINASCGNGYGTLLNWQQATGRDLASLYGDPGYINPAGDFANFDLHLGPVTWAESMGTLTPSVPLDIDSETRNIFSPTDVGADCGHFLSTETPQQDTGKESIKLYPNPATGSFYIQIANPNTKVLSIIIRDPSGREVMNHQVSSHQGIYQINAEHTLPDGLYLITILTEEFSQTTPMYILE